MQFDTFRTEAGLNRFVMTPSKWIEQTGAVGITAKAGRYGGTYAHSDIAMEFASWNLNREISKLIARREYWDDGGDEYTKGTVLFVYSSLFFYVFTTKKVNIILRIENNSLLLHTK